MTREAIMAVSETRKKAQDDARKAMQEANEERKKLNEEAMKRMDTSRPTPTQEENDLAKLGIQVEEKEDDKSGETVITRTIVANKPLGPHGYETRRVKSEVKSEQ
jgi:transcription elongation GreA/GreB family factor